ncbi:ankyrin [Parathielavia appendiculata]|uniref:Ankyrin n=1 Tax=Parathielavia appendiculata TaxID=2587402 RepID=A0AAN6TZ02_9PEZI|nr:ankyrin [Parathielavia appendiculata]
MAAKKGHEPVAELLLQCKADVESFNERTWTTALFEAVNQGREGLVKLLIENGADIDARQTGPPAARKGGASRTLGNADMAKLLLQHGANMAIRGKDGRSAQQIAEEQGARELAALLSSALLQQGPEITKEKGKRPHDAPPPIVPRALPAPRHNPDKMHACRCWEATMIEFYTEGREQRYQQSASIYDLLYGKGPKAVLDAKRPGRVVGETAKFTWYHLPANNPSRWNGLRHSWPDFSPLRTQTELPKRGSERRWGLFARFAAKQKEQAQRQDLHSKGRMLKKSRKIQ